MNGCFGSSHLPYGCTKRFLESDSRYAVGVSKFVVRIFSLSFEPNDHDLQALPGMEAERGSNGLIAVRCPCGLDDYEMLSCIIPD